MCDARNTGLHGRFLGLFGEERSDDFRNGSTLGVLTRREGREHCVDRRSALWCRGLAALENREKLVNNSGRPFAIYAWHNTTLVSDWWNYLMKMYLNSTDLVDPSMDIPKPEAVIPTVEDLYRRLFAIVLGKNLDLFEEPAKPTDMPGIAIVTETRIFLDNTAYLLSVIILCANAAHLETATILAGLCPAGWLGLLSV